MNNFSQTSEKEKQTFDFDSKENQIYSVQKNTDQEIDNQPSQEKINDKFLYFWQAKEYEKKHKDKKTLMIIYLIFFGLVVYSFFINNLLMSVLFILVGFIYYLFEKREPKECTFGITYEGIVVDDQVYSFDEIKSFWIFYNPGKIKELSLESSKFFMPFIEIPLGSADPVKIHRIIREYIPEKEHHKPIIQIISKYLD